MSLQLFRKGVKLCRDVNSQYFNQCNNSWCRLSKDILTLERYPIVSKDIDSYLLNTWHYLLINWWFACNILGDSSSVTLRQNRKIINLSKDTIGLSLDTDSYLLHTWHYLLIKSGTNQEHRSRSVLWGTILPHTPPVEIRNPPQWKLRDPSGGNIEHVVRRPSG